MQSPDATGDVADGSCADEAAFYRCFANVCIQEIHFSNPDISDVYAFVCKKSVCSLKQYAVRLLLQTACLPLALYTICIQNKLESVLPRFTKEDCLEDIKRRVLSTELAPGADLDEVSLCEQYGMSRTPLREVLQRLQGEGYVELAQNRGAKVASMDIGVLRTFFQTAPMVYANIAQLACENGAAAQLADLKDAQRGFAKAAKASQAGDAALANHRFHALIGDMAQNPYLVASLARLQIDHTRLSQRFYRPSDPAEMSLVLKAIEQHDAMISAFEAREGALAIDLTLQHWDLSRDRMERFVRPDPLPVDVISLKDRRNAI